MQLTSAAAFLRGGLPKSISFRSSARPPLAAQHGEGLLWSQWLEKHPDTGAEGPDAVTALLADPDTRVLWEQHLAETYYSYWEQYTYWAAQGWTVDPVEESSGVHPEQCSDGGPVQSNVLSSDLEALDRLLGQSCSLEDAQGSVVQVASGCQEVLVTRDCCSADEPQDGGSECKRPAGSSQRSAAAHTGRTSSVWDEGLGSHT